MPVEPRFPIYEKVSLEDFEEKFDAIERLDDKLDFLSYYVLSHGVGEGQPGATYQELISFARNKFLESSNALREKYKKEHPTAELDPTELNPYGGMSKENEAMATVFLNDPIDYFTRYADSIANGLEPNGNLEARFKEECIHAAHHLPDLRARFEEYENDKGNRAADIMKRISKANRGNAEASASELLKPAKAGWAEWAFFRTSRQYKAFEQAMKDFNDPKSERQGDRENLERTSLEYLRHKLPNFANSGDALPKLEDINALKGVAKTRAKLAYDTYVACLEVKARESMKEAYKAMDLHAEPEAAQEEVQQGGQQLNQSQLSDGVPVQQEIQSHEEIDQAEFQNALNESLQDKSYFGKENKEEPVKEAAEEKVEDDALEP